jgi:hypothetical protein
VRRALILAALAATAAAALPSAAAAAPGDFSVWSCRDALGNPADSSAWVPYGTVTNPATRTDTCASGGYLQVQMPDPTDRPPGGTTGFKYTFPAGLTPVSYRIEMAGATSSPPDGTLFAIGLTVGGDPATDHITDGCQDDSATFCTFGSMTGAFDQPGNSHSGALAPGDGLAFSALCIASSDCIPDSVLNEGRLYRSEVTFSDTVAPTVGAAGGSATESGTLAGHKRLTLGLHDVGSGVHQAQLLVDGVVIDTVVGGGDCAAPYTTPIPCPGDWSVTFDLDTTALADGAHSVVVRAADAAGNTTDGAPLAIDVSNPVAAPSVVVVPGPTKTVTVPAPPSETPPAPPAVQPPAPVPPVTLSASKRRVSLKRADTLRGTANRGGVQLTFERRPFGGDEDDWTPAGTTRTAGDGTFRFPVVRQSGQIRVQPTDPAVGGRALIVNVVARLKAKLRRSASHLRNGDTVTLRGRIRGDGGAWSDREVLIQAIVRGHWRTIDTAEVSDRGRVTWRYRFEHTSRTADYRFRLRLPNVRALPWKAVTTKAVSVLVKGD